MQYISSFYAPLFIGLHNANSTTSRGLTSRWRSDIYGEARF